MLRHITEDFGNGGTIDGDLTISGDLTVSGGGSLSFDEIIEGTSVIDVDSTTALVVRKNNASGDVLIVDTDNSRVGIGITPTNHLHVFGATANGVATFESGDAKGGIALKDNSTSNNVFLLAEGDDFFIQTGGSENRLRVDSNGNIALGTTPQSGWQSSYTALQLSNSVLYNNGGNDLFLGANFYFDGSNNKYITANGRASAIGLADGALKFFVSSSTTHSADDNVSFNQALTIDTSGNVGIGSDTSSKLTVVTTSDTDGTPTAYSNKFFTVGEGGTTGGNVFISYDQTNNRGYIGALTPGTAWRDLILNTGGGNVAIGTSSIDTTGFDKLLHIEGGSTAIVRFTGTNYSNDGGYVGLNYGGIELWNKRNAYMRFGTNNTERFRIEADGSVVIGATTAQQKFEVHGGGIRINGNITTPSSGVSGALIDYFGSDTRFWSRGADASTVGSFKFIGLENDGGNQSTQLEIDSSGNATFAGIISLPDGSASAPSLTNTGDTDTGLFFLADNTIAFTTGGTQRGYFSGSGNIEWANGDLSIGNIVASGDVTIGATGNNGLINLKRTSDGVTVGAMGLSSTNVLDLSVSGGSTPLIQSIIGGTTIMKLDADSRISLSNNDSGSSNTLFGFRAGNAIADAGNTGNVLIGHNAGKIANNADFHYNVAIGYATLQSLGGRNLKNVVAIGTNTMRSCDSGAPDGTVAIGSSALYSLTSGEKNVSIGFESMLSQTTGANNTVIGYNALRNADGGESDNVVIGKEAGININHASADANVIIGSNAGFGGAGAMSGAVAIGANAMNSTGSNTQTGTVAVGYSSLTALTSGANNVAMGYQSGDTITTGSGNTIIGTYADAGANAQNQIVIGQNVTGLADNTVTLGNSSITDVYMAQDSGATVHAGGAKLGSPTVTGFATSIKASTDVLSLEADGTGGPQLRMTDTSSSSNDDQFGLIDFSAKDAGGNLLVMNRIQNIVTDNNASSTDSQLSIYAMSNDTLTETVRIGSSIMYLPQGQLQFPASQNASSDANTLDDYEEGTHTATMLASSSGTITLDSTNNKLAYTKIGRVVHITGELRVSSVSSPTGNIKISLPFTASDLDGLSARSGGQLYMNLVASANVSDFMYLLSEGSSTLRVYLGDATSVQSDSAQQIQAGTEIGLDFSYFV